MNKKQNKVPQVRNLKRSNDPKKDYPNPGMVHEQKVLDVHENNHFKNHSPDDLRKRYLQFTVFMEQLNFILELKRDATVEQFATRVHDLVMAAAKA